MTSVTVQLTAETENRLRLQASQCGQTLEAYLLHLAEREASAGADASDMLTRGLDWLTHREDQEILAARQRILGASPPPREVPTGKTILDVIEGTWPGSETDAEIREALDRIS